VGDTACSRSSSQLCTEYKVEEDDAGTWVMTGGSYVPDENCARVLAARTFALDTKLLVFVFVASDCLFPGKGW